MRMRWTPAAAADLERLSDYLKEHHPHYRQPTMRKLYEAIRSLKESPHRGHLGREDGCNRVTSLENPRSPASCHPVTVL